MSVTDPGPRTQPGATPLASPGPGGPGRKPNRRGPIVLLITVLVAGGAVAWIVTHAGQPKTAAGGPPGAAGGAGGGRGGGRRGGGAGGAGGITSVNAARATVADVPVYLEGLGTVTPAATVTVRSQLAGQLFSVAFREGQTVAKGQLLAQVDPRPYQQALAQQQGALARDEASLANARIDLKRYQTLLAQDSIAKQQVDTAAANVRSLEGTVALDRAAVGAAKVNLDYTRITAPVSGKVGLRQVDAGNYVTNGDANGLVTITQVTPIDVVFTVPEDSVAVVNKRLMQGAKLPVSAFDRAQKTQLATGVLSTLDNQIDTTTGTVKAKARFTNGDGSLYPNQFVNVRVTVDTLASAVTVPTSAVLRGQNGLFVYTVDGSRTVHMKDVQTGPAAGEVTAITSGVSAGEMVVTDGSDRLREGAKVMLPGDCPPAGMGGGAGGRRGAGAAGGAAEAPKPPGFFARLFGAKPADAPAAKPGVGPDGQRCRPVSFGGGEGGGSGTQAILAQLNLDPTQAAKIKTITAAAQAQVAAARESGDFAKLRTLRATTNAQIEAVLRPDQKARFEQLRAQQATQGYGGGAGGAYGGGTGGGGPASVPSASAAPATTASPASEGGSTRTTTTRTTTRQEGGPGAPAPSAPGGGQGGGGGGGGGGGRMQALFAQLDLDAGQQAKIAAIRADQGPKVRAAYEGGDMEAAGAARRAMMQAIEGVLRPDQRARLATLRAQQGGAGGGGV